MTPTKLLVGQFAVVLAIILAGIWFATQWAAASLAYQSELGAPWFRLGDMPVYYPWLLFVWWFEYEAYAPAVFDEAGGIAAAGGLVGCGAAVFGSLWRARQRGDVTTYGSARWAQSADLKRAGLLAERGVFLGRFGSRYLRHDGPEHVMAFAPTRSGKGVGLVVPTLLGWTGSTIVHDIKGENWKLTAGWRARFSHCLLFNPTDPLSARYNPLLEVRRGVNEVRDVQNIADILVDPEGALERRGHWEKTGHALLVGAILHVLYAQDDKTLAGVAQLLSNPERTFEETLHAMMATNHLGTEAAPRVHPVVAAAAREVLNKSVNERSGVLSTAMSFLSLYRDPTVSGVTAASDWRIADIVDGRSPVSLYLVVPPSDISRTKPLIRLILNQIGRRLTEDLPDPDPARRPSRHELLMMLDEFPALGRLDFFETSLAFLAGYGVRAFLIAQSLNQIEKAYGEHNAILDNCHIRVAFATNDERTAKRISDALGTATEQRAMRNYAGHRLAPWLAHVMVSRQETARALLTPGEVMQLPANDEIVMLSGAPPVRASKLRYYREPAFARCVTAPPELDPKGYRDLPAARRNDWTGQGCDTDDRLAAPHQEQAAGGCAAKPAPVTGADRHTSGPDTADRAARTASVAGGTGAGAGAEAGLGNTGAIGASEQVASVHPEGELDLGDRCLREDQARISSAVSRPGTSRSRNRKAAASSAPSTGKGARLRAASEAFGAQTENAGAGDVIVQPELDLPLPVAAHTGEREIAGPEDDESDLAAERRQIVRIEQQREAQNQVVRTAYALDVSDGRAEEIELGF